MVGKELYSTIGATSCGISYQGLQNYSITYVIVILWHNKIIEKVIFIKLLYFTFFSRNGFPDSIYLGTRHVRERAILLIELMVSQPLIGTALHLFIAFIPIKRPLNQS